MPVLVRELLALYETGGDASALPRVTPYRDYLAWVRARDGEATRAAWRAELAELEEGTRVAPRATDTTPPEQLAVALDPELTDALGARAEQHGITLNTIIQAAWGLLLARLTGRNDVVFGTTVSG